MPISHCRNFFIFYFAVGQFFIDLYFAIRQYVIASEEEGGEAKAHGPPVVSLSEIGDPPGGREDQNRRPGGRISKDTWNEAHKAGEFGLN